MSPWVYLIVAGLLEVCWAIGLKYTEGFTRLVPSVLTLVTMGASFWMLSQALRHIPMGTAYGVWVGIGAAGAAILGMAVLREPFSWARVFFIGLLIVAIIGLKVSSPAE